MPPMAEPSDPAPPGLGDSEQALQGEALTLPLKAAVFACLAGRESRRWLLPELLERLRALGVRATRASVAGALLELEAELEALPWLPWRLAARGEEWVLEARGALLGLLLGARGLAAEGGGPLGLSEEEMAVLTVVIGYRRRGGASKTRAAELLRLDAGPALESLEAKGLVRADRSGPFVRWVPRDEVLHRLGYRAFSDVPALAPLEAWFEAQERRSDLPPDGALERVAQIRRRRAYRDWLRASSVGRAPGETPGGPPTA